MTYGNFHLNMTHSILPAKPQINLGQEKQELQLLRDVRNGHLSGMFNSIHWLMQWIQQDH